MLQKGSTSVSAQGYRIGVWGQGLWKSEVGAFGVWVLLQKSGCLRCVGLDGFGARLRGSKESGFKFLGLGSSRASV